MNPAAAPARACDCHVHVVGPKQSYPLIARRSYTPPDAPVADLKAMLARLGLARVVIVQPSFYGTDNRCLLDALAALGPAARGVAVLPDDTPGSVLDQHHRAGVRGLRINVLSSGPAAPDAVRQQIAATAKLCARNGWHIQMWNGAAAIAALAPTLRAAPVATVLDHFGLIDPAQPDAEASRALRALLAEGRVWMKLSAPYRITDDPFDARVAALARLLAAAGPERIVWGSDWPHTPTHAATPGAGSASAETPYRAIDTRALLADARAWFPDARTQHAMLVDNPARLYGFD